MQVGGVLWVVGEGKRDLGVWHVTPRRYLVLTAFSWSQAPDNSTGVWHARSRERETSFV